MLVYTNSGMRRFDQDPVVPKRRPIWEFWALLQGSITLDGAERELPLTQDQPTLWAFPPNYNFDLHGTGAAERAVFDFSFVPQELEQQLGAEPYYEVALTQSDCTRIRELAELAQATVVHPTQLAMLRQNSILHELSLIALREIEVIPPRQLRASRRTQQAER